MTTWCNSCGSIQDSRNSGRCNKCGSERITVLGDNPKPPIAVALIAEAEAIVTSHLPTEEVERHDMHDRYGEKDVTSEFMN